ncbi:hypothetical protein D9M69_657930 [compost metagenome]
MKQAFDPLRIAIAVLEIDRGAEGGGRLFCTGLDGVEEWKPLLRLEDHQDVRLVRIRQRMTGAQRQGQGGRADKCA